MILCQLRTGARSTTYAALKHDMIDILNDAQDDINIPNILNITVGCMVGHSGLAGAAISRSPAPT